MNREARAHREALHRDMVWVVLWAMAPEWVYSRAVWLAWLDDHPHGGEPHHIGRQGINQALWGLWRDRRVELPQPPGTQPRWRAVEPTLTSNDPRRSR
jgi:hypothetical protein